MTDLDIKRINELYHKSKSVGLTDEEAAEQKKLREEYIKSVRGNIKSQLDATVIVDPDGTRHPVKDRYKGK